MDIVDEAKELIPWLDEDSLVTRMAKHIEFLRLQNERLRQQNAELLVEMERIADVSERWEDCLVSQINEIARAAIAKATGGE